MASGEFSTSRAFIFTTKSVLFSVVTTVLEILGDLTLSQEMG